MTDFNSQGYKDLPDEPSAGGGVGLKPLLLVLLLVGAVVVFFLVNNKAKSARTVWVVNGTTQPYDIEIDGQIYTVPYSDPLELKLAEGTHTVRLVTPEWGEDVSDEAAAARKAFLEKWVPAAQEQTFTIDSGMGLAVLDGTTFVLNPDGAAMLLDSDVVYGDKNPTPDRLQPLGLFHAIEDIDDAFVESPNSVETSSVSSGVIRRRLDSFIYEERLSMPGFAGEPLEDAELKQQVAARLAMDFDGYQWNLEAQEWMDEAEAAQLALTRATPPTPGSSSIPAPPRIEMPTPHRASVLQPAEPDMVDPAAAAERWAVASNELFTIALTEDIGPSNGGAKVAPVVAAVKTLAEGPDADGAEQVLYLLRRQVSASPDRVAKLEALGVPARVRLGTYLVRARNSRGAEKRDALDAARALVGEVEDVPAVWIEMLAEPAAN